MEADEFNQHDHREADYYHGKFTDLLGGKIYRLRSDDDVMLSEEDIDAIEKACFEARDKKYAEIKAENLREFETLCKKVDDEGTSFEDRLKAISEAQIQAGTFHAMATDEEKSAYRDLDAKRDVLIQDHFKSCYQAALAEKSALSAYDALVKLEEDAREHYYIELDEILGVEWTEFYEQQEKLLYAAKDDIIAKTDRLAEEGKFMEAYLTFGKYFSSFNTGRLEKTGHDLTDIDDHNKKLLRLKTKAEFDKACGEENSTDRVELLNKFAHSHRKLDEIFGPEETAEMRSVMRAAFIDGAKAAVEKYSETNDETDLWRAACLRRNQEDIAWREIVDDFTAFEERVERNGHQRQLTR